MKPMPATMQTNLAIERRGQELFDEQRQNLFRDTDRLFAGLLLFEWIAGIAAALWISPRTWAGTSSQVHIHVWAAVVLGGAITLFPALLGLLRPGATSTRHVIAIGQMLTSALLIHLSGGRIETHFHVFGSLAFLAFYRDWRVFIPATVVVAADHLLRGLYFPQSVFGVLTASPWRSVEHAAWVLFENVFLVKSCWRSTLEMRSLAERQAKLEEVNETIEGTVRERTAALRQADAQYRHLVESAQAIVWRANENTFRFEFVSRMAESILGYPIGQWTSDPCFWLDHIHPSDRDRAQACWRAAAGMKTKQECEYRMIAADGRPIWLRDIVQAIREEDSAIVLVGVMTDIGTQKQVEEELKRATAHAEAASRSKSDFLANMSHEIRTPLNGVLGMTELALATDLTDAQREYLTLAKFSADSLLTVVSDILDFSKIEAGKLELDPHPFPLRETLEETAKMLGIAAHKKGLELTCQAPQNAPDGLRGDSARLRQVIVNLVGNAIKFTERGEVAVRVELESCSDEDTVLRFSIRDTGIGIPIEKHDRIFAAFTQADGSTTRSYGGTGLGLTISARLVKMMGGRIWLESEAGKGSTFYFTARFGIATDASPRRSDGHTVELRGVRVLIVDDNATNRMIFLENLKAWGMTPVAVESGRAALAALKEARDGSKPFRLLLLDVNMPEMDGFDLIHEIQGTPDIPGALIMMLTSSDLHGDVERCRDLNVAAYLTKPVSQAELRSSILRVVGTPSSPRTTRLPGKRPLEKPDSPWRILLAEDNLVNQKVAVRLLERRGYKVTVAATGVEALSAWESQCFDLLLLDVHMPQMDGLELTAEIRRRESGEHVPIIAVTAGAFLGDREECLSAGMDGYISKPINSAQLYELLDLWIPSQQPSLQAVDVV